MCEWSCETAKLNLATETNIDEQDGQDGTKPGEVRPSCLSCSSMLNCFFALVAATPRYVLCASVANSLRVQRRRYRVGESFPNNARRTILIGGKPCFMKLSWNSCNVNLSPFIFL
jgi:hypothetical protein